MAWHIRRTSIHKALVDTGAQCTLMPSNYSGVEPICISGVTGGSQQLTLLEAEVSLTGKDWHKHPIVTGPDAPCILGTDYLRRGYFKDPREYWWAFGIAALEEVEQLSPLPGLSEDPSVVWDYSVGKRVVWGRSPRCCISISLVLFIVITVIAIVIVLVVRFVAVALLY